MVVATSLFNALCTICKQLSWAFLLASIFCYVMKWRKFCMVSEIKHLKASLTQRRRMPALLCPATKWGP